MIQTERNWHLPPETSRGGLPAGIPQPIVQVLLNRGVNSAEKLTFLLEPPHKLPYNPLRMSGMDLALQRLYQAIEGRETVGIFGDFDVDGITGTAIVAEGLKAMGASVVPYLPHRGDEGHGLSSLSVQQLVRRGVSLIITVDCGVSSVAEVAEARRSGADVIITDHHTPPATTPAAISIINPKVEGSQYPFGDLCGAGIAFKLMQGLYQYYGQDWSPALMELAALGTIADLVPLVDENRFLVRQGLVELAQTRRPGLLALYRCANVKTESLNTETVAFQIAPRLNAAGRMSHADESLQLLLTRSGSKAEQLARRLEGLNQDRRDLTEQAFAAARKQLDHQPSLASMLIVFDPDITPGIAGLVAGRLVEKHHRPAVVLASIDNEQVVASGRSIPEFNLIQAFTTCADLFVRYGGHSQAAGFTLEKARIPIMRERLTAIAQGTLAAENLQPALEVDVRLRLADLTLELLHWLRRLEPFGVGNPQPRFLIEGLQIVEIRHVGQSGQHIRLRVRQGNLEMTAMAFNQAERWADGISAVDLVCTISIDFWNGAETITLKVIDLRPASR
ncbi:MAG TPA: single-stranded-DNA-specific exonuclease RecJ [Dehalococcoidia bacterium]|nr:single-stranded-DNA-specific exonuclease RecJ [Dehalococcoidia bacterium]